MSEFEVYTTGGGYYLYDIFNFLAMFTSGNAYQDMLLVGIILGVFYAAIKIAVTGNMQGTAPYLVAVAVVGALGVGPKARVIVMDSTYPLEVYGAVDNVPFSVAFVANLTSSTSYHLTRRMETLLSTPDNLVYQEHGMLFGASLMAQASRWRAVTPSVHENLVNFMENCMIDGTNIGLVDLDDFTRSGDLAGYITSNVPGSLAFYDEAADATVACADGWTGLNQTIADEVTKVLQARAAARAPREGTAPGMVDVGALTGTLEDFQGMMGMAGYNSASYIRQAMLVLALDDAAGRLVANSGNSAAMELYQVARAEQQTRSSYQIVGASASKWVPILKIAFETLYLGAFPIAMLLMMTPLAVQVIRGYFGGFVWLAAWEPLSAILHTTLLKSATGWYREHTTTLSGTGTTDVLNWSNHLGIQAVEQEVGAVAGYLMMSVPFMAFALMFGASRMAGLATSMLNVSQGSAIETGREASTGNVSLANVSMNNMSANKWNTSSMFDSGRHGRVLGDGGIHTRNADGSVSYGAGSAQSNVGMSAVIGQTVREEVSDRASEAWRSVDSQTEEMGHSIATTASQLSDFGRAVTTSESAGGEVSFGMSDEQRFASQQAWQKVERFAETHGLSTEVALQAMIAGNAGLGVDAIAQVGASLSANGSLNGRSVEDFSQAAAAARDSSYSETLGTLISSADRSYSGSSTTEASTGSNSVRSNLDEVKQSAVRLAASYEEAKSLETANSFLQSQDMAFNARITDAVISKLADRGYSEDEISGLVNPKTMTGVKRQNEVVGEILPEILKELGLERSTPQPPAIPQPGYHGPGSHTPINHGSPNVQMPQMGNLAGLDAHVHGLAWTNTQAVSGGSATGLRSEVNTGLVAGENRVDDTVGWAITERAGGIVGLGGQSPVLQSGSSGQASSSGVVPAVPSATGTQAQPATASGSAQAQPVSGSMPLHLTTTPQLGGGKQSQPTGPQSMPPAPGSTGAQAATPPAGAAAAPAAPSTATAHGGTAQGPTGAQAATPPAGAAAAPAAPSTATSHGGTAPGSTGAQAATPPAGALHGSNTTLGGHLTPYERDVVIRTVLGEAANESDVGWAAVAHVIQNRVADPRWGDDPAEVALQMKQFSAWNTGAGGNSVGSAADKDSPIYQEVGKVVDQVFSGQSTDMTQGATHYYSPAGMQALVDEGSQSNLVPAWFGQEDRRREAPNVEIGGHIFTGAVRG